MAPVKQTSREVLSAKQMQQMIRRYESSRNAMQASKDNSTTTAGTASAQSQTPASAQTAFAASARASGSASSLHSTVELIKGHVADLEKTLARGLIKAVQSEVKGQEERLVATPREGTKLMQDALSEDLAAMIQDKAKEMQAALLDSIKASRDTKYEELVQQLRDVNANLAELSEASELQDSDIDRLENERGRLAQELNETKQKLDETKKELDDQKELAEDLLEFARRSRGEQVGLEARLEKLEAALFGPGGEHEVRGGGTRAADQEEEEDEENIRSYTEVLPATSRAASPAYHQKIPHHPRDEANEDGDVQQPLPKRARAKVGGTLRFGCNSGNRETLVADENDDGNASG